jgi:hypothetical protein
MSAVDELRDRAAVLKAASQERVRRGRLAVDGGRWCVSLSLARLARPRAPFRGGSDPIHDEATVRLWLRALVQAGIVPPGPVVWAGLCRERHDCMICGAWIEVGQVEYEIPTPSEAIFLHGHCYSLWPRSHDGASGSGGGRSRVA